MEEVASAMSRLLGDVRNKILESLRFREIRQRHAEISQAHKSTFEWIFEDGGVEEMKIGQWLESGNGYFWLSGKPGSGKSTLMKFIAEHYRTAPALSTWSGTTKLVTAKFFFWNAGTPLQKSQVGLLRSLLFEILEKCPELLPLIYHIWAPLDAHGWDWRLHELSEALEAVVQHDEVITKFCFFIDGLDEYQSDQNGGCGELIDILSRLVKSENIKVLLSSRPWNIFIDAFGQCPGKVIKLEDLTRDDIKNYVQDKFCQHPQYESLLAEDPSYSDLVQEIVDKALGVFLWVFLVVRELLGGLTDSLRVPELRRRVMSLPPDLEGFFEHIIDTVDPSYRDQTSMYLELSVTEGAPFSLMTYSFVGEDQRFAFDESPSWLERAESTSQAMFLRLNATRRRLNAFCNGLLEVEEGFPKDAFLTHTVTPIVRFLHRTVRDFLLSEEGIKLIRRQRTDFQPDMFLCRAYTAQIQICGRKDFSDLTGLRELTQAMIFHASVLSHRTQSLPQEVFSMLDRNERSIVTKVDPYHQYFKNPLWSFQMDCVFFCLYPVVRHKLAIDNERQILSAQFLIGMSSLGFFLQQPEGSSAKYLIDDRIGEMVELLLEFCGNPNQPDPCHHQSIFKKLTIWTSYIQSLYTIEASNSPMGSVQHFTAIVVQKLIGHGADPFAKVPSLSMSAVDALREILGRDKTQLLLSQKPRPGGSAIKPSVRKKVEQLGQVRKERLKGIWDHLRKRSAKDGDQPT